MRPLPSRALDDAHRWSDVLRSIVMKDASAASGNRCFCVCERPLWSRALDYAHRWGDMRRTAVMRGLRAAPGDSSGGITLCT